MVEIKHTPGSWRAEEWSCHAATTVLTDDPTIVTGKRVIAEFESVDDARLGAAAPDLLDAAAAAEAVLSRGRWIEGSTDPEAVALWKLRAALAKATEVRHGCNEQIDLMTIEASARVILSICSSTEDVQRKLAGIYYASKSIECLVVKALEQSHSEVQS